MPELLEAFLDWLGPYRVVLTGPGFQNLLVIVVGWVQTIGRHAITQSLVATGVAGRRHHEAFHRFFSRGTWNADGLGLWLFERVRRVRQSGARSPDGSFLRGDESGGDPAEAGRGGGPGPGEVWLQMYGLARYDRSFSRKVAAFTYGWGKPPTLLSLPAAHSYAC